MLYIVYTSFTKEFNLSTEKYFINFSFGITFSINN